MSLNFNAQDASQIFVGAFALAVPIAFQKKRGDWVKLYSVKLWWLFVLSMVFLSLYTYESVFQRYIAATCGICFSHHHCLCDGSVCCRLSIVLFRQAAVIEQPWVAFARVIVITMPASMGAIVVDSFDK